MEERLEQLQTEYDAVQKRLEELEIALYLAESECKRERTKTIEPYIPKYTQRLQRLGRTIHDFLSMYPRGEVRYAFRYVKEGYVSDGDKPMADPLDWTIVEYDLLGMSQHLDIVFDYSVKAVRYFIENWMKTTLPDIQYEEDIEKLFGFKSICIFNT